MTESNQHFTNKCFWSYLIPSILSILGGNISITIDHCVAGAVLGEQALAAMSIANPMFNVITAFGLLICGGASTLASVSIGSNDTVKKNTYFTLSIYLTLLVGGVVTVVGLLTLNPFITILGASGELFPLARDYCGVMLLGSVTMIAVYIPLNFFRIEGMGRVGMVMFFIMSTLDIVLDLLFVAVFSWGMAGLALATVISALIAVATVSPKLMSPQLGYRLIPLKHPMADVKELLYRGSPLALGNLYTVIRVRILNSVFLTYGGSLALAAYACANNVSIIGMALISGIAQTVAPIVGVLYGERDGAGIRSIAKKAVKVGLLATLCFGGLAALLSRQLAMLFGMNTPQQWEMAQTAIVILSANLVFVMLSSILIYCYMTCSRTGLANLLTFAKGLGFVLLFSTFGARILGTTGALLGTLLAEAITVLLALAYSVYQRKKDADCEGILLLSHRIFGEGTSMACSVLNSPESISEAATRGGDFCEEQGVSPKQGMTVSLGVEEMMVLMSKYALSDPEELIEFRLFISALETVVRIRCGGKWFNPLCFEAEDEFDNMGVKILLSMAKGMSYSTNLGMNNIQIII